MTFHNVPLKEKNKQKTTKKTLTHGNKKLFLHFLINITSHVAESLLENNILLFIIEMAFNNNNNNKKTVRKILL